MRYLELKIPPVVVVLLWGTLMAATSRLGPGQPPALWMPPALALGMTGTLVSILGVISFRLARTTVNPLRPEAASNLVTTGIYRRTRNPMYLGMLLVLLGWGVFLTSVPALLLAVAFVPAMNRLQIIPEERALAALFGPEFTDYRTKVRRWL